MSKGKHRHIHTMGRTVVKQNEFHAAASGRECKRSVKGKHQRRKQKSIQSGYISETWKSIQYVIWYNKFTWKN